MIQGRFTDEMMYKELFLFFVYSLTIMILVMVLSIISRNNFEETAGGYHSLLDNWKRDFVYEVSTVPGSSQCPVGTSSEYNGYWSGTVTGCNCLHVFYCHRRGVSFGQLDRGICNSNETLCGCIHVSSTPQRDLVNWQSERKVCFGRKGGFNFYSLYKQMNIDGQCKDGFKACGKVSGISKGICIPDSVDCPVTRVQFGTSNPDAANFQELQMKDSGSGNFLYYSNSQVDHPIIDTKSIFGSACLNPANTDRRGRSNYVLMRHLSINCDIDERYVQHNPSEGERTFFDMNNVIYYNLPAFETNDNIRYNMYSRQLIEWSPKCHDLIEPLYDLQNDIYWFQRRLHVLFALTMSIFIINILLLVIDCIFSLEDKKNSREGDTVQKNCIIPVRTLFVVSAVILQIQCAMKASKLKGLFLSIGQETCSDDYTNKFFVVLEGDIRKYLITFQVISAIVYGCGICLEFFCTLICHCPGLFKNVNKRSKKRADEQQRYNQLQAKRKNTLNNPKTVPIRQPVIGNNSLRNRNRKWNNATLAKPNAKPMNNIPSSNIQPYNPNNIVINDRPLNPPRNPAIAPPIVPGPPPVVIQPVIVQPVYVQPVPVVQPNGNNTSNDYWKNIKLSDLKKTY